MSLPSPRLDDRTFQQLVDEAKGQVQQRCPEWSDHNVSDPGVTLIETFAWMTDMLLYRLNRVPDQLYLRFLELVGVRLFPPQAARTEVSFRLKVHHLTQVVIPAGTAVSTRRTVQERAVGFTTVSDLEIPPATSRVVARRPAAGEWTDLSALLGLGKPHQVFSAEPQVDDALYIGLDQPAPRSIVLCQFVCIVAGHGIDEREPPLVWEAWTREGWARCDVQRDDTLGLNISEGIELHVPAGHAESVVSGVSAAWLRCRVVRAPHMYRSSPEILSVSAATVGGSVEVINAERVLGEQLGVSDATTGQRFTVGYPPVLPDLDTPLTVQVAPAPAPAADGSAAPVGDLAPEWETWEVVEDFAASAPDSRHFVIDRTTGEIRFGPAVRLPNGAVRRYGDVPRRGAALRLGEYRTGGGAAGNVAAQTITVLRTSNPSVRGVYNRFAATGGVDGETVPEARVRGPLELRRRSRAVTVEDYVALTRESAPELARVHCVPVAEGPDAGAVRLLLVPQAPSQDGRITLTDLLIPEGARQRVLATLERARVIGARISVEPPSYVGIRVDATVRARDEADPAAVAELAARALYGYFNPISGGPGRNGWPFGRPVQAGEVFSVLGRVPGLDYVEEVKLYRASPRDRSISAPQERIDLAPTHLVISVEHNVTVPGRTP